MPTKIEWTDETWNPVTGCTKISPGCANCYAETMCRRFWRQWDREPPPDHFGVKVHIDRLDDPLYWKNPRMVFVCSMGDLFHDHVPNWKIEKVNETMARCPQHTFQLLTKRPKRMMQSQASLFARPLSNVWCGVTTENQEWADERIPYLLKTPAAVRFVSAEPLLGPIELERGRWWLTEPGPHLDWVIIGCESGPNRRPMELEWAIDLVHQCRAAGVACFVKQIPVNGKVSKDPGEWPEELRVREYPIMPMEG